MRSEYREIRPVTIEDMAMMTVSGVDFSFMVDGSRQEMVWGNTPHGFGPVALLDVKETEHVIEPHVRYMPWTSSRERVCGTKWYFDQLKKTVFLIAKEPENAMYDQMTERGILKKIGVLPVKSAKENIHMYHKVENE